MMGKNQQSEYSIRRKRADFLFNDGEYRPKVIAKQKRKMIDNLREQEEWDEFKAKDSPHEGS